MKNSKSHKLADKGWKQMQILLDQEMPSNQQKHPTHSQWRSLAIVFLLSALLTVLIFPGWHDDTAHVQNSATLSKQHLNTSYEPLHKFHSAQTDRSGFLHHDTTGALLQNTPASGIKKSALTNVPKTDATKTFSSTTDDLTSTLHESVTSDLNHHPEPKGLLSDFSNQKTEAEFPRFCESGLPVPATKAITNGDSSAFTLPNKLLLKIPPYGNTSSFIDFNLNTSFVHGLTYLANGWTVGLEARHRVKTSRWSWQTGINYLFLQLPLSFIFSEKSLNLGTQQPGSGFGLSHLEIDKRSSPKPSVGSGRIVEAIEWHYLSVPIQFAYSFGKKLYCLAGFDVAFLLSDNSKYFSKNQIQPDSFEYFDVLSSPSLNSTSLAKVDFGILSGIEYKLHPRIFTRLIYRTGLTDVIRGNGIRDGNNFLRFGVGYNL